MALVRFSSRPLSACGQSRGLLRVRGLLTRASSGATWRWSRPTSLPHKTLPSDLRAQTGHGLCCHSRSVHTSSADVDAVQEALELASTVQDVMGVVTRHWGVVVDNVHDALEHATTVQDVMGVVSRYWGAVEASPALVPASLTKLLVLAAREGSLSQISEHPDLSRRILIALPRLPPSAVLECFFALLGRSEPHCPFLSALAENSLQAVAVLPLKKTSTLLKGQPDSLQTSDATKKVFAAIADKFVSLLRAETFVLPTVVSRVAYFLWSVRSWPEPLSLLLVAHLERFLPEWTTHRYVSIILWLLWKQRINLTETRLLDVGGEVASRLMNTDDSPQSFEILAWIFGSIYHYQKEYFESLSQRILAVREFDDPFLTPRLLSTTAWACARTKFYSGPLLEHIAAHALPRLHQFNIFDMRILGYAYGYLNHCSRDLLTAIVERLENTEEFLGNAEACLSVAWACMVHNLYSPALLKHVFSSQQVQVLLDCPNFALFALIQLNTAVTHEHPHLGIPGCSLLPLVKATILDIMASSSYRRVRSVFESDVLWTLENFFRSESHFNEQVVTRQLYTINAEVLLDDRGAPLLERRHLMHQSYSTVRQLVHPLCTSRGDAVSHVNQSLSPSHLSTQPLLNLASDWDAAGASRASRRVAVEADGPVHFAVNCEHALGRTTLKHRQLRALGWEVVSIPYFEWNAHKTESNRAKFIRNHILKKA